MRRRFSSQFLGMNSTVVYEYGAAYVVDPGVFPQESSRILNFLHKKEVTDITVLLTHTHGDHISGWQEFSRFPCYAHECISAKTPDMRNNDVRYLRGMW
ncbi:MAG: MBL fold metallo-hydrolase, partial [Calditrichia bacterium]